MAVPEQGWLTIVHPDQTREHVRLSLALTTIGRAEQNVIELLDPKLSRFHCEIERHAAGYAVRDCNSRNGTLVNGEPAIGPHLLSDGDRIKIGRTFLTFHTQRPPDLRSDPAIALAAPASDPNERSADTPSIGRRRPTANVGRPFHDRRQTQAVETVKVRHQKPYELLAVATLALLDAKSRAELLELTVERAQPFFQARGALLALGSGPDDLTVTAAVACEGEALERCQRGAARVLTTRGVVHEERRLVAVPIRARGSIHGALVLHDLAAPAAEGSQELEALQHLADVTGRALTGSLMLEEVRREERGAGARRVARDLRSFLHAEVLPEVEGLEVGRATAPTADVGADFWDAVWGPPRAGRRELYLALGDVPDPAAPPPRGLRRRGERSLVSLLGQAEVRGALRALVEALPRTSDLLAQLALGLRRDGCVDRVALTLLRYDPTTGALRFAGGGHPPLLVRRADGAVEVFEALAPPVGQEEIFQTAERDLALQPGDQAILTTAAAGRVLPGVGGPREALASLVARLAVPAHPPQEVAKRLVDALAEQADDEQLEGLTVLVLRRS